MTTYSISGETVGAFARSGGTVHGCVENQSEKNLPREGQTATEPFVDDDAQGVLIAG